MFLRQLVLSLVIIGTICVSADVTERRVSPAFGIARGFSNIMFGWLELPRGVVYETARIPVVGLIAGPVKGSVMALARETAGVVDVVSFGLTREGLYAESFPEFVWDADWIPAHGVDIIPGRVPPTYDVMNAGVDGACTDGGQCGETMTDTSNAVAPCAPSPCDSAFHLDESGKVEERIAEIEEHVRRIEELAELFGR